MGLFFTLFIPTIIIALLLIYKFLLRRRFPANVTCWFCGGKTEVPYDNRNCWDCPSCEQYNGFDKDGSYNKPIPAQYDERLNKPIKCQEDDFIGGHNVLCDRCTQNQLLKIKQLANFIPYNEKNYDEEVDAFKRHIEKVYRLCLPCEIKVQQELQLQDEAISKRFCHLDDHRSFMETAQEEQTFLHASYTDRRFNKYIMASIILHTISLVCSVLVVTKEISLDGDQAWQKQLLFLHPILLWLDKNAEFLAVLGLMSGVAAKLSLGKYRLHIIDAVSCPVWLLVLLSQTGFLIFHETGSVYHICSLVLNCVTSAVCLGINRRRRDRPNQSMMK
ncbi:transmembrane protein 201-like [Mercenaria mercenaria]|uniref:transmembrane protein 201-like n=1 Tax=Mercenaria mercenaria TaxID=6596 RepID=UPI00234F62C9|nr:transmembrane protein 201-like [Mercenaria mercenaria]